MRGDPVTGMAESRAGRTSQDGGGVAPAFMRANDVGAKTSIAPHDVRPIGYWQTNRLRLHCVDCALLAERPPSCTSPEVDVLVSAVLFAGSSVKVMPCPSLRGGGDSR